MHMFVLELASYKLNKISILLLPVNNKNTLISCWYFCKTERVLYLMDFNPTWDPTLNTHA